MQRFITAIIAVCFLTQSQLSVADPLPDFPFLTVSEEAKLTVKPDMATLNFYVKVEDKSSEKAINRLNQTSLNLIKFLLSKNITEKDISSHDISKRPVYARNQSDVKRYEVSQYFEVKLAQLEDYAEISKALLATDHLVQFQSRFDVKNREQLEFDLIQQAGANARISADNLAASVGASVLSVFAINKDSNFNQFFATFGFGQKHYMAAMRNEAGPSTSIFIPEQINVSARVNVVYKISQ